MPERLRAARMPPRRGSPGHAVRIAIAGLLAGVGLSLPTAAFAGSAWSPPVVVAAGAFGGNVAENGDGLALAGWMEAAPSGWGGAGVAVAVRQPGGSFGTPQEIYAGDGDQNPSLAVGGDGSMYASFIGQGKAYLATAEPGGSFGNAVPLGDSPTGSHPAVGADDRGDAIVAWADTSGNILAASKERGGGFGAPVTVGTGGFNTWAGAWPRLAMNPLGDAAIAWPTVSGWYLSIKPRSGPLGPPTLIPGSDGARQIRNFQLSVAGNGDVLAAWFDNEFALDVMDARAVLYRGGKPPDLRSFPSVRMGSGMLASAAGADGQAILAWVNTMGDPIAAAFADEGQTFGEPQQAPAPNVNALDSAAIDSHGNGIVLWGSRSPGSTGWGSVESTLWLAGHASPCAPDEIVGASQASPLRVATDAHGGGIAVWQQIPVSQVRAAFYTAPESCPEPAPPAADPSPAPPGPTPPGPTPRGTVTLGSRARLAANLRTATLLVACGNGARCDGRVTLSAPAHGAPRAGRAEANGRFALAAGSRSHVRVRLSRTLVRLARSHRRIRTTAIVRGVSARMARGRVIWLDRPARRRG